MPNKSNTDLLENEICSIDSIKFSRIGKPDWIDRGDYPKEELTLSFTDKEYKIHSRDSLVITDVLDKNDIEIIRKKLDRLKTNDLNKIYNSNANWDVELELFIFCHEDSNVYMIKSFGQHGENPKEIADLYSILLRYIVSKLKN